MSEIEFKNINKQYGKSNYKAVKNFNLKVEDGEFIVLVGPSGCGKTTLLRMLAGLESITSGEILINGKVVNDLKSKDRDIAMVFQNFAIYPHMTARENLLFGLSTRIKDFNKRESEIQLLIDNTMKELDIYEYKDRYPRELSGGQNQRVALGRALVREPGVFLMDEPLSSLDAQLRSQTRENIINLHKKYKASYIYVTHDQVEAMTMGDRIVVMDKGVIQQVDTPRNVFYHPNNIFVAKFIGSPQINLIPGILINNEDDWFIRLGLEENQNIKINHNKFKGLKNNMKVFVGIRPEGFKVSKEGPILMNVFVRYNEFLGNQAYLHCDALGINLIVKHDIKEDALGSNLSVSFEEKDIHVFEAETGKNLAVK